MSEQTIAAVADSQPSALEAAGGATEASGTAPAADAGAAAKPADAAAASAAEPAAEKSLLEGALDEAKPADGEKKADEAKPAEVAAEPKYAAELKKPEGIPWNEATWKAVAPVLSQHQIPQEAAQGLIDAFAAHQSSIQAEHIRQVAEIRKEFRAKCAEEFQPADYRAARMALDKQCPDEGLRTVLMRELGDHPAFIRMMAAFGRAISDDSTPGAANSGGGSRSANQADKFYGGK